MRLSRYFLPVLKENPADAHIVSHRFMLRAGMIKQSSAGIYSWLPLGLKTLNRIAHIVHEEQIKAGHHPMLMPTIQSAELWQESGRYDDYGAEMLRITDRHGRKMLYGPTNEELITDIFRTHINSYKDLPLTLYQIQWKFRDEIRPRFGVMRGREFYMKDGYSFDIDKRAALHAYNRHMVSYLRIYERMGLNAIPMRAASGPIGGNYTHEFLVLAETGESAVFYDDKINELRLGQRAIDYQNPTQCQKIVDEFTQLYARTDETHDEAVFKKLPKAQQKMARGIEVGQIFYFGTKYSEVMNAKIFDKEGRQIAVHMGSHGIGVSRLLGAIIEANHDERGIIWPESVSPFHLGLINLGQGHEATDKVAEMFYNESNQAGIEVLYDDRKERAGVKFATMDLIGIAWQIIIGKSGVERDEVELVCRRTGAREILSPAHALDRLKKIYKPYINNALQL